MQNQNKAIFFVITFIPKYETTEVYNSRIIKEGLHFQCQSFLQSMLRYQPSVYGVSIEPELYKKIT